MPNAIIDSFCPTRSSSAPSCPQSEDIEALGEGHDGDTGHALLKLPPRCDVFAGSAHDFKRYVAERVVRRRRHNQVWRCHFTTDVSIADVPANGPELSHVISKSAVVLDVPHRRCPFNSANINLPYQMQWKSHRPHRASRKRFCWQGPPPGNVGAASQTRTSARWTVGLNDHKFGGDDGSRGG